MGARPCATPAPGGDVQLAPGHHQVLVRRDDVDVIRLRGQHLGDLPNRHPGAGLQQLRHLAFVMRIQMYDDDKRHSSVLGQIAEESLKRAQPASGRSDAHDGKALVRGVVPGGARSSHGCRPTFPS